MIFVESKQVNLDMMDQKGAKFLKILQEKNVKGGNPDITSRVLCCMLKNFL